MADTYIIIEGIDGTGKDTQADLLVSKLYESGRTVLRVNEPDNDLPTGKLLRQMLKEGTYIEAHAAMFLADRMAMLAEKVRPALAAGHAVVSVRSWMSTLVYQQENWPLDGLMDIHRQLPVRASDLIVLDLDPAVALQRATRRPGHNEFYEKLEIQQRNRTRYLDLVTQAEPFLADGGTMNLVNAFGTPDEVHALVCGALRL